MKSIFASAKKFESVFPELIRFFSVGVINTSNTILIIWTLMWSGGGPYVSNFCGYAWGMIVSFVLNRFWTFRRVEPTKLAEVIRFLTASAGAYSLNLLTVACLLHMGSRPELAQLAGMPVYTLTFFFLAKFFVFASTPS